MDAASYTIKERLLSEALVLLDKREMRICVLYRRDPYPLSHRIIQKVTIKNAKEDQKIVTHKRGVWSNSGSELVELSM